MGKFVIPGLIFLVILLSEFYLWKALQISFKVNSIWFGRIYWTLNILLYFFFFTYRFLGLKYFPKQVNTTIFGFFLCLLIIKLIVFLFFFFNDIVNLLKYALKLSSRTETTGAVMTRSAFLSKMALATAAIPVASLVYGVVANAYNYQFKRLKLNFPNLPKAFEGFTVVQLSDIHSGSFNQSKPIEEVIEKINALKADLILFTGDLVNDKASEMDFLKTVFSKLKSTHGVMSVTGNHDYGDYVAWGSKEEKRNNFKNLMGVHKEMGWDLLMNEHRVIEKEGEKIAILGIENWGYALRFPRYGKLNEAYDGTQDIPFKILMSHDPSHWDAEVRKSYQDIDLTLSGHTHGFQFGIETKYFRFSPSQWVYKQWAGLYQEGKQYIYVNRGFGFLGYPGRVGILPEVTVLELSKG